MHWMVKVAKTAVWLHLRLACASSSLGVGGVAKITTQQLERAYLRPECVDTIHFKAPSHVGDRVLVAASVTRVFLESMEVAIRVSSNSVETQDVPMEVNVGYMSFSVRSSEGPLTPCVPDVVPSTVEQDVEYRTAVARQRFRELRQAEAPKACESHSVDLDTHGSQVQEIAVQCISCILCLNDNGTLRWERLASKSEEVESFAEFGLSTKMSVTRMKLTVTVKAKPKDCFLALKDIRKRPQYDVTCLEVCEVESCGENADLVRMIMATGQEKEELLILRAYQAAWIF